MSSKRRILPALANIVACAITLAPLAIALAALSRSDHPWPDLANQFVAPALLASVAWTVVLGLFRLRTSAVFALVVTALLTLAVWPQWFPARGKADPASESLTVYSANLWARNTDVRAMAASIKAANPDVVLLVELGDAPSSELDTLLPDHPYRLVSSVGNRNVAPARALVASRWPLEAIDENTNDRLVALSAKSETPLGPVAFSSVHLTRPWPYRQPFVQVGQVEDLAMERQRLGQTVIIAGDFNSVSSGRIGRQMKETTGLAPAPGFPGTWPSKYPSPLGITIDQVWHSTDLVLTERKLGRKNGSDHRPVITRYRRAATDG
ncbi:MULTISPECIES: endonuclease/exonuclease/phosphatase family protein [unclassified Brevundimonas]|uniref:endonuclease/exonuclease/phosphatase family protein n=1 Tax=unclassified Brevundimonas TaxID=2622653 RepID=UPI0025C33C95|nr:MULTISPECIES: endonuclease/exonuclease/phosphatase family protein [unclassified Brevundimonas]